jgi:NAD+ kinase
MKVLIFGDNKNKIEPLVKKFGFDVVENDPEFVISYGGDGTLIRSEFEFPGVPKVVLKNSRVCKVCHKISNEEVLERMQQNKFIIKESWKLEAIIKNESLYALNEIVIHNQNPQHCIRYKVLVDDKELGNEIIGDGIVIATPFGSTAYYRSITDSFFEVGIGVAFNNSTEQSDHVVLKENRKIKIKITRGPAMVYADNQPRVLEVKEGDEILIQKSSQVAKIISVD